MAEYPVAGLVINWYDLWSSENSLRCHFSRGGPGSSWRLGKRILGVGIFEPPDLRETDL